MSFKENFIAARSHITVILGIIIASGIIIPLQLWNDKNIIQPAQKLKIIDNIPAPVQRDLTEQDILSAKIAWRYFLNNYQESTGLVNSVDKYPATTMWESGSFLLALISAYKLEIISNDEFCAKVTKILITLNSLKLFHGKLPNKSYNTITLEFTDYNNNPSADGIGWSSIDIARIIIPLQYLILNHPEFNHYIHNIFKAWDINSAVNNGLLFAGYSNSIDSVKLNQEGRLGYEEYAAKSFICLGFDNYEALKTDDYLKTVKIYDVDIPVDSREPERFGGNNYVLSDPFILMAFELGLDNTFKQFAWRVYLAQQEKYLKSGVLTAVGEDHLDTFPHFVYNTVYSNGKQWNCITDNGNDASNFKSLSVKSAFGWHYLFQTGYTSKLMERIKSCYDEKRGWFAGIYDKNGKINKAITCNTNAVVLQSIYFKKFGKYLKIN
jgi:hypothetical protein